MLVVAFRYIDKPTPVSQEVASDDIHQQVNKANSYGPAFNSAGGGWYAMERTNQHINVYFWSRNDGSVPSDVKNGASSINTSNWVSKVSHN